MKKLRALKAWVERHTGFLFGTYKAHWGECPAPWLVVGPTWTGATKELRVIGVSVALGSRGFYVALDKRGAR